MLFIKKYTLIIYEKTLTHTHTLSWNHMFCWVHEGESWEGLAGGAYRRLLIHGVGDGQERELWVDVADVTRAGLERSDTCRHTAHSCDNQPIGSESFPTTLGTNGGLSFRAKRSSQSMGAKKECSCSSAWTHTEINPAGICCVWYASPLACALTRSRLPPKRLETHLSNSPCKSEWAAWVAPPCSRKGLWRMFSNISALLWL